MMNILEIGNTISGSKTRIIKYLSNSYFLDADLLIIDLESIIEEFYALFIHVNAPQKAIKQEVFTEFIMQVQKRKNELENYFKVGGNLLLFNGEKSLEKFFVQTGETLNKSEFDFLTLFNLTREDFEIKPASGHNVNSEHFYQDFFEQYICSYQSIFIKHPGKSIASVARTSESVGLCLPIEKGNLLFLPPLELPYQDGDDDEYRWWKILKSLEDLNKSLKDNLSVITNVQFPEWIDNYMLGSEKKEKEKLLQLEQKATELQQKIAKQYQTLDTYLGLKTLLFESGGNLETSIEKIFRELGYEILPAAKNRDDLIIKLNQDIAVIEIKGVNGSASEKNAAQLEKWVSEYYLDYGIRPKGILIVNAFREKPLNLRNEPDFPNQMMKYATRRDQCLISSTDLLNLYLAFLNKNLSLHKIHELLFNTIGVLVPPFNLIEELKPI